MWASAAELDQEPIPLRRHAIEEAVGRDVVGALHEDGRAVDLDGEALAVLVVAVDDLERAQANAHRARVADDAGDRKLGRDRVQMRAAEPVRPPALRASDRDVDLGDRVAAGLQCRGPPSASAPPPASDRRSFGAARTVRRNHRRRHPQRRARVGERLPVCSACIVVDARRVPGLEPDRAPHAAGHEARAPVPAVVIGRLARVHAHHRRALIVGCRQDVAERLVGRRHVRDRRAKPDQQRVLARVQVRLHRDPPRPEHVVGRQRLDAPLTKTSA